MSDSTSTALAIPFNCNSLYSERIKRENDKKPMQKLFQRMKWNKKQIMSTLWKKVSPSSDNGHSFRFSVFIFKEN